jgi:hypothetical protein
MDEDIVREHAQRLCDALVDGDVGRATEDFSPELRQNLGEVIALLPLPSSSATIESVEYGANGYNVAVRLTGETEEVVIETRWKDRDGRPTVVEVSHQSRIEVSPEDEAAEGPEGAEPTTEGTPAA